MKNFVLFKYSLTNGLTWGILGGLIFAFIHSFDPNISRDIKYLIDFSFWLTFVFTSAMTLNVKHADKKFLKIFGTTTITFVLIFSSNPIRLAIINPLYRNEFSIISFLLFLSIGIVICSVISFLALKLAKNNKNFIILIVTMIVAIGLFLVDSHFDGRPLNFISNNPVSKILAIFLTLGGLVGLFHPFTFKKEISETDISKISKKAYKDSKEEDERNRRIEEQARF